MPNGPSGQSPVVKTRHYGFVAGAPAPVSASLPRDVDAAEEKAAKNDLSHIANGQGINVQLNTARISNGGGSDSSLAGTIVHQEQQGETSLHVADAAPLIPVDGPHYFTGGDLVSSNAIQSEAIIKNAAHFDYASVMAAPAVLGGLNPVNGADLSAATNKIAIENGIKNLDNPLFAMPSSPASATGGTAPAVYNESRPGVSTGAAATVNGQTAGPSALPSFTTAATSGPAAIAMPAPALGPNQDVSVQKVSAPAPTLTPAAPSPTFHM